MLDFVNNNFESVDINICKELKETMFKRIKGNQDNYDSPNRDYQYM